MKALTGRDQPESKLLDIIMSYCYHLAKRLQGFYTTSNNSTILLYYQKSAFKKSVSDWMRYLQMAFFVIGPRRILHTYKREAKVNAVRNSLTRKFKDKDFIYVWFMAQKDGNPSYKGLLESSNHVKQLSMERNLPIYMETTESRLLKIYERAGFVFYDVMEDVSSGLNIWFGRYSST